MKSAMIAMPMTKLEEDVAVALLDGGFSFFPFSTNLRRNLRRNCKKKLHQWP